MTQTKRNANPEMENREDRLGKESGEALPSGLRRPVTVSLTRMLAGRPVDEEILDPANPNLMFDREHERG
ncbi:MAG: hypothetical protein HQL97_01710 [Magnetococcales bacterium]|nr:hypothetical protein [Magnetococcales bacterium]